MKVLKQKHWKRGSAFRIRRSSMGLYSMANKKEMKCLLKGVGVLFFLCCLWLLGGEMAHAEEPFTDPIVEEWTAYEEIDPYAISPETAQEEVIEVLSPEEIALAAQTTLSDSPQFTADFQQDVTSAFPDEALRSVLREALHLEEGQPITDVLCSQIEVLQISGRGIYSLEGIKYLTGMRELISIGNPIAKADFDGMENLQILTLCQGCLEEIHVEGTGLTSLNLKQNALKGLDLSGLPSLEELEVSANAGLETVTFSGNDHLRRLLCNGCSLGGLNLTQCPALEYLEATNNHLLYMDLQGCLGLKELDVAYNGLTWLDLRGIELSRLDVRFNQFSTYANIRLEARPELVYYNPQSNSELSSQEYLSSDVTGDFTDPAFRDLVRSLLFLGEEDPITPGECLMIPSMNLTGIKVHSLAGIEHCLNLSVLRCYGSSLENLSLSGMKMLTELYCWEGKLSFLDLSGCTALEYLLCEKNQLKGINLSGCESLQYLYCYDNQIRALDVTSCLSLKHLDCQRNELFSLNLMNNPLLEYVNVAQNYIASPADISIASGAPVTRAGMSYEPQLSQADLAVLTEEEKESKKKNKITLQIKKATLVTSPREQVYYLKAEAMKGELTYQSNREEVKVTKKGKVKIPAGFTGTVKITITSKETKKYRSTSKTVKIKVKPIEAF